MSKVKSHIINAFKLLLSIGVIGYMIKSGAIDFDSFSKVFEFKIFLLGMLLVGINLALVNERWRILLASQNIQISFPEAGKLSLIGIFFNYLIPGGVGGDVARIFYLVKGHAERKAIAGMSIVLDRVLGLFVMLFMTVLFLNLQSDLVAQNENLGIVRHSLNIFFAVFIVGLIVLFKFNLNQIPMPNKLRKLYQAAHQYGKSGSALLKVILISFIAQSLSVMVFVLVGQQLGLQIPLQVYFFIVPIGFMLTAIPISPAGIGVGQVAFHFLFKTYAGGVTQVGALGITALQVFQFIFSLWGAWFFLRRKETLKELESAV